MILGLPSLNNGGQQRALTVTANSSLRNTYLSGLPELFNVQIHGRISTEANKPALAYGSPAAISFAACSDAASITTRLPFMVSPSASVKGPASLSVPPRLFRYSTCWGRFALRMARLFGLSVQIKA